MRWQYRCSVALFCAFAGGLFAYVLRQALEMPGPGDFRQSLRLAQALVARVDPYSFPTDRMYVPSPLPAAFLGIPLLGLPPAVAGAIFFGASVGLLSWGVMRDGEYWRLMMFASWPFMYCALFYQYPPLIMVLAFIPALLPVLLVKPQDALPLLLIQRPSLLGLLLTTIVMLVSLALYPEWPWIWLSQAVLRGQYEGFIPLVWRPAGIPVGLLLLAALPLWRRQEGRFLLAFSAMPQRMFYDQLLLFIIPRSPQAMFALVSLSWLGFIYEFVGGSWRIWVIASLYLPALLVLLWEARNELNQLIVSQADKVKSLWKQVC